MESLVFGAFTVLYGIAIWILLYRDAKRNKTFRNKMLFTISTLMWLLSVSVSAQTPSICPVGGLDAACIAFGNRHTEGP